MEITIIFISSKKSKKIKKYIDQFLIFSYIIYVIDSEGKKKKKKRCWHGVTGSHTRFRFLYRKM